MYFLANHSYLLFFFVMELLMGVSSLVVEQQRVGVDVNLGLAGG
jgi:hypothetical protein